MEEKIFSSEEEQEPVNATQEQEKTKLETSVAIINELDLTVDSTTQLPTEIFSSSAYQKQSECIICQKKFGIFLKKRHCKFCGNCVCDNHAKRRRANPQKPQKFVRCCDSCHYNYLKKIVEDEFLVERKEKEAKIREVQSQLKEKQKYRRIKEKEFKDLEDQFKNDLKEFNESKTIFDDEILKYNEEIKSIQEQTKKLSEQNAQMEKDIAEIIENISTGTQATGTNMQEIDEQKEKLIALQNEIQSEKQKVKIQEKFLEEVEILVEKTDKKGPIKKEQNQNQKSKPTQQEEIKKEKVINEPEVIQKVEPKQAEIIDSKDQQENPSPSKNDEFLSKAKRQKKIEPQDSEVKDVNSCKICVIY